MIDGVVHCDGLPIDIDRVGDVDVTSQRATHAFGNHRLPVSRRAVEEHRAGRVDGRTEAVEHLVVHDQIRETTAEAIAVDVAPRLAPRAFISCT